MYSLDSVCDYKNTSHQNQPVLALWDKQNVLINLFQTINTRSKRWRGCNLIDCSQIFIFLHQISQHLNGVTTDDQCKAAILMFFTEIRHIYIGHPFILLDSFILLHKTLDHRHHQHHHNHLLPIHCIPFHHPQTRHTSLYFSPHSVIQSHQLLTLLLPLTLSLPHPQQKKKT